MYPVNENHSILTGILVSCYKLYLLRHTISGMEFVPVKEGSRWGSWSDISHIQSIFSHLAMLPPPANIYGMYNQVRVLKLPTSLSSSPDGHILFLTGTIICLPSLFPRLARKKNIIALTNLSKCQMIVKKTCLY